MKFDFQNAIFIDFEDSFSGNIIAELKQRFRKVYVLNWRDGLYNNELVQNAQVIVLGPGPGHVDDYNDISPFLIDIITKSDKRILGICLGHQLIWKALGGKIKPSLSKVHGQTVNLKLPDWPSIFSFDLVGKLIKVQRYNSWTITPDSDITNDYLYDFDSKEILGFSKGNLLGFQFHPESIGTDRPDIFFDWMPISYPIDKQLIKKHSRPIEGKYD